MPGPNPLTRAKKSRARECYLANRLPEAKALYARVTQLDRRDVEAWALLGAVHEQLGEYPEAEACLRQALSLQPNIPDGRLTLGNTLLKQGRIAEAETCYRQELKQRPDHAVAYNNLATVLVMRGNLDEAIDNLRRAVTLKPGYADAYANLGNAFVKQGRLEEAINYYRQAITLRPDLAEAYNNLANALHEQGKIAEAESCCRAALKINPRYADAHASMGSLLCSQGRVDEAITCYREALRHQPDNHRICSSLLLTLQYSTSITPDESFAAHRLAAVQCYAFGAGPSGYPNTREPDRRLRIGYVSPDFRTHSVAYFIEPILAHHDPGQFEVVCYSDVTRSDATTERLRNTGVEWRDIWHLDDAQVTELVRDDKIDLLIDLAGHTSGGRLRVFSRKPAPIQLTYLGYPDTTGLSSIDYRLTDAWADPPGIADHGYTETLVRLPHGFLCYQPPLDSPSIGLPPCEKQGYITFGSFNNLSKFSDTIVKLWSELMLAVPNSRLVLKNHSLADKTVRDRVYAAFENRGVDRGRIEMHGMLSSTMEHLALYNYIDIALDTFPYHGTTTTCEALWMGVPVVTLAGQRHASRVGVSLLSRLGHEEWIAQAPADYVRVASTLARDQTALIRCRTFLRADMESSLLNHRLFMQDLEASYRKMWRSWCSGSGGELS